MDPVSQAVAIDAFEKQSFSAVGWYHSHPTFAPNPSLQDIETQASYQAMSGDRPFVGAIVSPFFARGETVLRWLETGDEVDPTGRHGTRDFTVCRASSILIFFVCLCVSLQAVPRALDVIVSNNELVVAESLAVIANLYRLYANYHQCE